MALARHTIADEILFQTHSLIQDLGRQGGLISASEYDTAVVLRFAPPAKESALAAGLNWLLSRQHPDGGFGNILAPQFREMISLCVALTLHHYESTYPQLRPAREAAIDFVRHQTASWDGLPDDMPIGAELIIPALVDQAEQAGMDLPTAHFAALRALGDRRRQLIAKVKPGACSTASHSWESWGIDPDPALLDESGGVGHSPAATAAWLYAARDREDLTLERQRAEKYLRNAATATGTNVPGVVPNVWPIDRFEQIFCLLALDESGMIDEPVLQDVVQPQLEDMAESLFPRGLSFSSFFTPDGDDTATAMVVLARNGYEIDPTLLAPYASERHFATWPGELQMSLSTTAHAVHALALVGQASESVIDGLIDRQQPEGCWLGDKWHSSLYYITSQSLLALREAGQLDAVRTTVRWLLSQEYEEGGWGVDGPTPLETGYAVLALRPFMDFPGVREAISRALPMLMSSVEQPLHDESVSYWIGKTLYRPFRVDRMFELCAAWVAMGVAESQLTYRTVATC
jgi:hypothetical protein